jgi:hypothetical protein
MRLEDRQPWTEASQDDISHSKHDRTLLVCRLWGGDPSASASRTPQTEAGESHMKARLLVLSVAWSGDWVAEGDVAGGEDVGVDSGAVDEFSEDPGPRHLLEV